MNKLNNEQKIINLIFKDFLTFYNSRIISKLIGISHAGAFKLLKNMEKREIVKPTKIGRATIYSLNTKNPISIREIEMALTVEAQNYKKWQEEFKELKNKAKFVILFGSILKEEKSARDIDILVVADRNQFSTIKQIIQERNNVLNKKIHLLLQDIKDFEKDIKNRNKVIIEIIKSGVVVFGQEEVVKHLIK
jgi:predicted nucleotidyltransferase